MRYISYCFSTLLLLFILSSCGSESTPVYNLTTTPTPDEAGSVSPSSGEYDEGESVEITATPNDDWVFESWEGDASGSENPTTVTMDADKDIAATFVVREYPLTIEIKGEGTVQEEVIQEKTTDYPAGTTVELTANAADGWKFIEWQGVLEGNENPQQITIDDGKSVTAVFERKTYDLTIEIQGNGKVEQEVVQAKTTEYEDGTQVKLTAISEGDWRFVGWKEDATGTESEITVTVDRVKTVIASFDDSDFEGGDGSEKYPYEVASIKQLQMVNNYTSCHFVQIKDIDGSETENWNGGGGFIPIGDDILPFKGSYNGGGNIISNLHILRSSEEYIGLFGIIGTTGIVQNTVLRGLEIEASQIAGGIAAENKNLIKNSNVTGNIITTSNRGDNVGGLVAFNSGSISNSYSEAIVTGKNSTSSGAGGLVARNSNDGEIIDSYATGDVSGTNSVGGLTASNGGIIENSYATGNVSGRFYIGGLSGFNSDQGIIKNSYATGNVSGNSDAIGGLVGMNRREAMVSNSHAVGIVSGRNKVGGLIGENSGNILKSHSESIVEGRESIGGLVGHNFGGKINNSNASGKVNGNTNIGGLVGLNDNYDTYGNNGEINNSFATGDITFNYDASGSGGLVGVNAAIVINAYAKGNVEGQESVGGLVGINKNEGNISLSYSIGSVSGESDLGGFIGTNGANIEKSYWDTESSEQADGVGRGTSEELNGLVTTEIQGASAEENMSEFDWDEIWMTVSDDYPILRWQQ